MRDEILPFLLSLLVAAILISIPKVSVTQFTMGNNLQFSGGTILNSVKMEQIYNECKYEVTKRIYQNGEIEKTYYDQETGQKVRYIHYDKDGNWTVEIVYDSKGGEIIRLPNWPNSSPPPEGPDEPWLNSECPSTTAFDPWGKKQVLNYLFWTADPKLEQDVKNLQKDLSLTDKQMSELKRLGLEEYQATASLNVGENLSKVDSETYNRIWQETFQSIDSQTRAILGDKYGAFRLWIVNWWQSEVQYREQTFHHAPNPPEPNVMNSLSN